MTTTFQIFTDSSCDLPHSLADTLGLCVLPLHVTIDGRTYDNHLDGRDIGFRAFFDKLRSGSMGKTSAVNPEEFSARMRPVLAAGQDILYIGFSSALSGTYQSGCIAADALREEFPARKILTIDSLGASLGQGLFVYLAAKQQQAGATLEQTYAFLLQTRPHLCHWFTVNDLMHLKRGGRVSSTAALVGTMLQIKPVMHMDDAGRLIPVSKVRGRKAALQALVDQMVQTAIDPAEQTVFICHGDCLEDAEYTADLIRTQTGAKDIIIHYVGPVIGAHTGPGVISIFFLGSHR